MHATLQGIRKARPRRGRPTEHEFLVGCACLRCDKIAGDAETEMAVVNERAGH